jgi:hypothetical protein
VISCVHQLRKLRGIVGLAPVAVVLCTALVGVAVAAPGFRGTIAPQRIAPVGRVTLTTRPVERCMLTVGIARRKLSHLLPYDIVKW